MRSTLKRRHQTRIRLRAQAHHQIKVALIFAILTRIQCCWFLTNPCYCICSRRWRRRLTDNLRFVLVSKVWNEFRYAPLIFFPNFCYLLCCSVTESRNGRFHRNNSKWIFHKWFEDCFTFSLKKPYLVFGLMSTLLVKASTFSTSLLLQFLCVSFPSFFFNLLF